MGQKIMVVDTKTPGAEPRPMTRKSFEYLSSKNRGFKFVGEIPDEPVVTPSPVPQGPSVEQLKAELRAKAAAEKEAQPEQVEEVKEEAKNKGGRPKKVTNEA